MNHEKPIAGILKWLALGFAIGALLLFLRQATSSDKQSENDVQLDRQARHEKTQ